MRPVASLELAQLTRPIDQAVHHRRGRKATLLSFYRCFDALGDVDLKVASVAAPLHHSSQVAQHMGSFRGGAFFGNAVDQALH